MITFPPTSRNLRAFLAGTLLVATLSAPASGSPGAPPPARMGTLLNSKAGLDYDRDVRPILAENCFKCHGFDEKQRMAGLRLDVREGTLQKLASGAAAIVPGNIAKSELVSRITDHGALMMPPASSGKSLTKAQIEILKRWVRSGAEYTAHWAFVAPRRPATPSVKQLSWIRTPIDRFILARLESLGMRPSPEADRMQLLRRVSLDLTGLPPTLEEQKAFAADHSANAYEKVVDRLLASPHYGERMALTWLDLARYADTHGYHIDSGRDMWPWRNWVIDAYNKNMPYDAFVTEQLAGDMLPNATLSQRIATGFNRNHPINFEGGAIPEEYAAAYIFDRIDTTATAFMGLTMRCGQCHDHKYDPISQRDYYRFFAFFHNVPENGLDGQKGNAAPFLSAPTEEQQAKLTAVNRDIARLEAAAKERSASIEPEERAWEARLAANPTALPDVTAGLEARFKLDEGAGAEAGDASGKIKPVRFNGKPTWAPGLTGKAIVLDGAATAEVPGLNFERTQSFSYGGWVYPTDAGSLTVISHMDDKTGIRGWDLFIQNGTVFAHFIHEWESNAMRVNTKMAIPLNKWTHLFVTYDGSSKASGVTIYVNGHAAELVRTHDSLTGTLLVDTPAHIGMRNPAAPFKGMLQDLRVYSRTLSEAEVGSLVTSGPIRDALAIAPDKRSAEQKDALVRYYRETIDSQYRGIRDALTAAQSQKSAIEAAIPTSMVMQEMDKPRDTFILTRGQYDKPAEKVTAGTPAFLPPIPANLPANRLGLARWLVSPQNPLTARVAVNRMWQQVFGAGIVRTPENFGIQGDRPTHPELLDWLATEFIRTGWDQKRMMRLLVTSAVYRQSAMETPAMLESDPENRMLGRAPRYRLPAEFVRDQALALSGLLVPVIGGPSVKPYQPAGLWEELAFGGGFSEQKYVQDHGDKLYRRSMYTFWKRTCPPATLQTFDAPEREFCIVRRSSTDTPLQALALLNDPTYVEAARKLAERVITDGGTAPASRLDYVYRAALCRHPRKSEQLVLLKVLSEQMSRFKRDAASAEKLLAVGESPRNMRLDVAELAAWTSVCTAVLNLDETITRN
jgi:Protein of unknown function (DUF1553)/Protein of unknown function (DUF1549)/Concanavalin A-like lectin/glucanases superfamily/Planctomycete cytochrome C